MACIVYLTNKKSGHVYAYESVSYRDPVTKVPKSKRKYLGRVDPITKEFLTNPGKKADSAVTSEQVTNGQEPNPVASSEDAALRAEIKKLQSDMKQLKEELEKLKNLQKETSTLLANIGKSFNCFTGN